ncbi:MAG: GHMP family kinase ATP-binding protein [Promethearchaeota archaeon]
MRANEEEYISIILAGGKGTRMGVKDKHKSTFEIGGMPSIVRLIYNLRRAGIKNQLIVVGAYSDQIMGVISKWFNDVGYVFQPHQKGTGNAAKIAANFLRSIGFKGNVLIIAGDAYIEPEIIKDLIYFFKTDNPDMAFLVNKKELSPFSGRILTDSEDNVIASVEYWDIQKILVRNILLGVIENFYDKLKNKAGNPGNYNIRDQVQMYDEIIDNLNSIVLKHFKSERKFKKIYPDVYDLLEKINSLNQNLKESIDTLKDKNEKAIKELINNLEFFEKINLYLENINNILLKTRTGILINYKMYDPEYIEEHAKYVNISVYLLKAEALYYGVERILSDNAQNEEYLTDIISILSGKNFRIKYVPLLSPNNVMSFNNPEELLKINQYIFEKLLKDNKEADKSEGIAKKYTPSGLMSIADWISKFENKDPIVLNKFKIIYGDFYPYEDSKIEQYLYALKGFQSKFKGENNWEKVFIARTPGRLNLMGRHIDHRGGDVNMIAIDSEVISVATARDDDKIVAYNEDPESFPAKVFSISEILSLVDWKDWFEFISHKKINEMVRDSKGDWGNYLIAAALRLQVAYQQKRIKGANIFITGRIPQAAGLSSSSALVVNTLEVLCNVNNLEIKPSDFIDLCGEGEWFIGTRGGSADHAAIKVAQRDKIVRLGFFDFKIKESVSFPENYEILIINSMRKARKSHEVLKKYNEKILAYEIGFKIIKESFKEYENKLNFLRDISEESLGISRKDLYNMIKKVPISLKVKDLNKYLHKKDIEELKVKFPLFNEEDKVDVRSVLLFGVSECYRSRKCMQLLKDNKMHELGKLMNISHNGDRVTKFMFEKCEDNPNVATVGDLIKIEERPFYLDYSDEVIDDLIEQNVPLEDVSGWYACSIREIDFIVDYLNTLPHVLGAQISGAGLGGCVMALIERGHAKNISESLRKVYKEYFGINPEIISTRPIWGSSIFF